MHTIMIFLALILSWCLRINFKTSKDNSWEELLFFFLFPPLLLMMTAIAVLVMGYKGVMLGLNTSWLSYSVAFNFLVFAIVLLLKLAYQARLSCRLVASYPQRFLAGYRLRILNTTFPYSGQIGFWQPELVVSQGLLDSLDEEHLQAVLAHEQAHYYYQDTFWFFWLGWLRSVTFWLPHSEVLWQDLLFFRELRADQRAAQQVDNLVLAESLLQVAQQVNFAFNPIFSAAFSCNMPSDRLSARIDALLDETELPLSFSWHIFLCLLLSCLPIVTLPFHN